MRINARLDEETAEALKLIQDSTGLSTTEIVKQSLQFYVNEIQQTKKKNHLAILEELAGIGEGPEDLSENYKQYLTVGLDEKHGVS